MSRIKDRDSLVAQLARELPDCSTYTVVELARKLLRAGTTLQRLAEAQCNGDYPYDEGRDGGIPTQERRNQFTVCPQCDTAVRRSQVKRAMCPDCRTQDRVTALLKPYGMTPIFNGDPRGAVFLVIPPSYAARNAGRDVHNLEGIYVS